MAVKRHGAHFDVTASNRTDAAMAAVEKNLNKVNGAAHKLSQTFTTVLGATGAITFGRAVAREVMNFERETARLNAVLRATGGAVGVTRAELESMAEAISAASTFDAGDLVMAQSELMKFGNIHGNVFRGALQLSADLAAFMGTEVPDAAAMIGKSLQSPTEGITQMERQFGKLTEAQKKHIEELVAQGRAVEAQNAILDLWQQKIGGTAELMNTGLTGAVASAGKAWRELLEDFGKMDATGGIVERRLRGVAEILDHIRRSSAPASGGEQRVSRMASLQEEIDRIQARIGELQRMDNQALFGPSIEKAQQKIAALKQEIMALNQVGLDEGRLRAAQQAQSDFEASLAVGQTPVRLGGRTSGSVSSNEAAAKTRAAAAEAKRQADGAQAFIDAANQSLVESAELSTQAAEALIYTWDSAGNRIAVTREEFEKLNEVQVEVGRTIEQNSDLSIDWGYNVRSALEDIIVRGRDAKDVLAGLANTIAHSLFQKAVGDPIEQALSGALGSGFGGLFGGSPGAYTGSMAAFAEGTDYVPKTGLAIIHKGEAIVPASENTGRDGGITFAPQINIDSRSDRAAVMADVDRALRASEARLIRQARYRSGAFGRSLEGQ